MLRTLVTERALTVMWQSPTGLPIGRVDIEMTRDQTANATFAGGQVGEYMVQRAGGCGCRGKSVKAAKPFPENRLIQVSTQAVPQTYGVPPTRWERKRG
jgi:hypothetical protein